MNIKDSINDTRKGFEESFATGFFYNRQTQDSEHLNRILEFVRIKNGMKILDLGTGSGYISFPIAKNNPGCDVTGLDIVNDALEVTTTGERTDTGTAGRETSYEKVYDLRL